MLMSTTRYNKTMKSTSALLFSLTLALLPQLAAAHAEHDKPRYVAEDGEDKGRCDDPSAPCRTIGYAAQQASKGDNILVAAGSYDIEDINTLFYLISNVVPVKGGYSRSYKRDASQHPTRLVGVPPEYADELAEKGFTVIVDRKGLDEADSLQLSDKMEAVDAMQRKQVNVTCTNGSAGQFPCSRIDLVAHVPLRDLGGNTQGNDIWGHYDLNDGREYAIMGLRNGTVVVDVTLADQPRVVSRIPGQDTTWRDIKVLQQFSLSEGVWKSYAYVTADNAEVGLQIIDLNELPVRATLANTDMTDISAHNVYLSNVDYSTGVPLPGLKPFLHLAGSNNNGGAFNTYVLTNPVDPEPVYRNASNSRANYSHDVASMVVYDERKDSQCVNASDYCDILFDFNENDVRLWDKTDNRTPVELSRTSYPQASYVHSGWWSEDKLVMSVHDELDEQVYGINTTLRFFDVSDFTRPVLLSTFTGPTRAIDHNGFVRGNRYYMSNYERGLTILDITNPAAPAEAGFFDTYPISDRPAFNGAWGTYPFLPSGLVLISDINSGLYLVRDNTLDVDQGSLSFSAREYRSDEGQTLLVTVSRGPGTTGAVSVGYETRTGSAGTDDFAMTSGRLAWADGEGGTKTFSISIAEDALDDEPHELFFVRLLDPQGGATLSAPAMASVVINGTPGTGHIGFTTTKLTLSEDTPEGTLVLKRMGGKDGEVAVDLALDEAGSQVIRIEPAKVIWADQESGSKAVRVTRLAGASGSRTVPVALKGEHLAAAAQASVLLADSSSSTPSQSSKDKSGGGALNTTLLVLLLAQLFFLVIRPGTRCSRTPLTTRGR